MEASSARRELLKQVPDLVQDMIQAKPLPGVPKNFQFHPAHQKLYFLATTKQPELLYVDLPQNEGLDIPHPLEWKPLLSTNLENTQNQAELSKEEQLRRERMRAAATGITSYIYHEGKRRFLIPAANYLYIVEGDEIPCQAKELSTTVEGARIDAKFSPDGNIVSFVRHNDLWVQDIATQKELRLTLSNPTNSATSRKGCGIAEYVMQEEFDRYTGYWWGPKSNFASNSRILFAEVDESNLRVYKIPEPGIHGGVDDFTYPLAGDQNAEFDLSIAEFETSSATDLSTVSPIIKKLKVPLRKRFPWCEYMPRAGWTPDGSSIWVQLLDRQQQHMVLATIDVDQFAEKTRAEAEESNVDPMSGVRILREEKTEYWINITDLLYFFKDGSGRVILGSEETGFRHLYLLTPSADQKQPFSSRALTAGDGWQVDDSTFEVDEVRGFVYFMGTKDSHLESHLYVVSLRADSDPTQVQRLTPSLFNHNVKMSSDLTSFVSCFSSILDPHRTQVYNLNFGTRSEGRPTFPTTSLRATFARAPVLPKKPTKFSLSPPDAFSFKNTYGETIYGCYFKPRNFDPTKKYPAVLMVYGGPHVQYVTNDYNMNHMFMVMQMYAHLGFVGVIVDGVGSWRRGLKFEGYLRKRMGTIEVQEQVQGLTHLIKHGFIDPERIAVRGWSYGGYLSLMCLAQRADFFKLAICGAPVTRWDAYDSAYTERYMDTPQNNPQGYADGSVLHYVAGFPDEPNRLMIIHGAIDENVHFCNTLEIIQELIQHDKPYQLLLFPQERHGVRSPQGSQYLETQICRFICDNL